MNAPRIDMPAATLATTALRDMASVHIKHSRRHLLAGLGASVLALVTAKAWAQAQSTSTSTPQVTLPSTALPPSVSLAQELSRALAQKQPLVVMVSLDGCPFCKAARESYLSPMFREEGLPIVQVDMRSPRATTDFAGAARTHEQMIEAWHIKVAPTLLFFGRDGVEVAKRMVGGYLPDFYGAYLDERLEQARRTLRG